MDGKADKILIKKLGRYEILSELGKGSMGIVYKAVDPLIDRTVAIKTINFNLSGDEIAGFVERFNREAKSAGRLNHPNIVTIYDVGKTDDTAFIAMEHLDGQELKEIIASKQRLQPERIVEITAQIADALAFAHDNGVVHRDIKPANIMVLRNGAVKIMDFGIAMTSSGSQTIAGTIIGSPKYMSPEQVSGMAVDGRTDIFSLGAILYELLTGISAFDGGSSSNLASIMYQVINEMPESPTMVNPSIPVAFNHIIAKALAKKLEDRYQSAREMADDLRNFKKLSIFAPLPSPVLPGKWPVKNSQKNGDATVLLAPIKKKPVAYSRKKGASPLFLGPIRKNPVVPGWSLQKKRISTVIAVLFLATSILFIYVSVTTIQEQSATSTESKTAGTQSKVRKNKEAVSTTKANLEFTVLPWGEIFLDGKRMGVSPPIRKIKISPGKHLIEVKNSTFSPYRKTVKLEAGESLKVRHKFN